MKSNQSLTQNSCIVTQEMKSFSLSIYFFLKNNILKKENFLIKIIIIYKC